MLNAKQRALDAPSSQLFAYAPGPPGLPALHNCDFATTAICY